MTVIALGVNVLQQRLRETIENSMKTYMKYVLPISHGLSTKTDFSKVRFDYTPLYNITRTSEGPFSAVAVCALYDEYVLRHVTNRTRKSPAAVVTRPATVTACISASSRQRVTSPHARLGVDVMIN